MDAGELAGKAVDAVARRLATGAGRAGDVAVDQLYRVVANRLRRTPWGARVLAGLEQRPQDPERRQHAREAVAAEMRRDPGFESALGTAARQAGIFVVQGPGARYSQRTTHVDNSRRTDNSGDVSGSTFGDNARVNVKKFHIGNLHFGLGGLVSGIGVLVVALGGGTTAIVASQEETVSVDQVVGTWRKAGGAAGAGITEDPTVLTIDAAGAFKLTGGATLSMPGVPDASFPDTHFTCEGKAEAAKGHVSLQVASGNCADLTVAPVQDGQAVQLGGVAEDGQQLTLPRS
ncbi:hypothetical protein [Amycolatopsis sp. NPDC051061]|uniref:hypothetical protein n=1 Tax=Amycolatopsis sp. NPDC051061 TaxID=3155042 RepID=UPI00341D784B